MKKFNINKILRVAIVTGVLVIGNYSGKNLVYAEDSNVQNYARKFQSTKSVETLGKRRLRTNQNGTTIAYKNQTGKVIIRYTDRSGNHVADATEIVGKLGSHYQTHPQNLDGFVLDSVEGHEQKTIVGLEQTVTYIYRRTHVKAGNINVSYRDRDGKKLASDDVLTGLVGQGYAVNFKSFAGYTQLGYIGDKEGIMDLNGRNISVIYEKNEAANAIHYINHNQNIPPTIHEQKDKQSGSDEEIRGRVLVNYLLKKSDVLNQPISDVAAIFGAKGDTFNTNRVAFEGLELVDIYGPESGSMNHDVTLTNYLYKERTPARVVAKYTLTDGTLVSDDEEISTYVGAGYLTKKKRIKGFTLVSIKGDAFGLAKETHNTVTYIYNVDKPEGSRKPEVSSKPGNESGFKKQDHNSGGHHHDHDHDHDHHHDHDHDHDQKHHHIILPATGMVSEPLSLVTLIGLMMIGAGMLLLVYLKKFKRL